MSARIADDLGFEYEFAGQAYRINRAASLPLLVDATPAIRVAGHKITMGSRVQSNDGGASLLVFSRRFVTAKGSEDRILTMSTSLETLSFIERMRTSAARAGYKFGSDKIKVESAGTLYASYEGIFPMDEGDIVIISIPTGARGIPPQFYVIFINKKLFVDLASENPEF